MATCSRMSSFPTAGRMKGYYKDRWDQNRVGALLMQCMTWRVMNVLDGSRCEGHLVLDTIQLVGQMPVSNDALATCTRQCTKCTCVHPPVPASSMCSLIRNKQPS